MSTTLLERFLRHAISHGTLEVHHAAGSTSRFGTPAAGYPDVVIRLIDPAAARAIILDPRIGAAEAFMDGRLVIEQGDIMQLVQLLRMNQPWERGVGLRPPALPRRLRNRAAFAMEQVNQQLSARRNVAHHYDIGNDLYRLMLDPEHMQYSCAYWPSTDMTLGQAQEAKLAHIASKLRLRPDDMVLDIGCGWGGMAIYLAKRFGVHVHGITLSKEQLQLAKRRAEEAGVANRIIFELIDYRDLPQRDFRYDRIVSVGMFEHVGRAQFETFFRTCASLLTDDGVMLLHTIGRMGSPGTTDAFTRKYIFPGGYIPALSETVAASEKTRLIASDVETWRLHYARTLRAWYTNCEANREAIIAMFDERFFRMWTFYLAGATAAFESGAMCNYQIQYIRQRDALPLTRDYMVEAERRPKS
ncbi:cyclopropane-fatty-acyl-phospholipid synthase family protein [Porphyrobacter sp. GA68]|uniref:SAM-dependent methyltransferase n=1 Tax=Porphyrobacter sp. GA68 TaxID=2883480 RepID=UPI001D18640E|nr:cyclopropane-fatty-acyl-phospholipid synthase family protein [Porphyrobacter sp. GA68]